jgi:hypothetical protein
MHDSKHKKILSIDGLFFDQWRKSRQRPAVPTAVNRMAKRGKAQFAWPA